VESLKKYTSFNDFKKVKKYVMDDLHSVDIDYLTDWMFAEFLIEKCLISFD
jgi:CMP-N-acetylneuraminic acid synthetase